MLPVGSIASDFAAAVGLLAGTIAVAGFLAHAAPTLSRAPEEEIRRAMVRGGLVGCLFALFVMLLSAIAGKVIA
jgi:hypothetical protein